MSTVRVYVNGRGVDAPAGGTALDAVRVADPGAADDVAAGRRAIADSRGLPAPTDAPVYDGAIFRLISARAAEQGGAPAAPADRGDADDASRRGP